jgi:hypothetical protein
MTLKLCEVYKNADPSFKYGKKIKDMGKCLSNPDKGVYYSLVF